MGPQANKTVVDYVIFTLILVANCLKYDAIHDFSEWLTTGSNPADINQFRSHTTNVIQSKFLDIYPPQPHLKIWTFPDENFTSIKIFGRSWNLPISRDKGMIFWQTTLKENFPYNPLPLFLPFFPNPLHLHLQTISPDTP